VVREDWVSESAPASRSHRTKDSEGDYITGSQGDCLFPSRECPGGNASGDPTQDGGLYELGPFTFDDQRNACDDRTYD